MNVKDAFSKFEQATAGRRGRRAVQARRAVAYIRVSTDEQHLGPRAQELAIQSYAERSGLVIVGTVHDLDSSGGLALDERPKLIQALEMLETHGAQVLLVAKRDRLARDVVRAAVAERLAERVNARVETADGIAGGSSPEDKLFRTMLDAFAEYERAAIQMRTRAALAQKRRRGERVGQIPYGYEADDDGHLHPLPTEQAAIAQIVSLRREGVSWAGIADAMNERLLSAARGARWHKTSIQRIHKRATS